MNWLGFWASIIGSLAWPATVIIVVLVFRQQLLATIPWLREVEVGSLKMKFAEGLVKAASQAENIEAAAVPAEASPAAPEIRELLASHAPRALVLESWAKVEQAVMQLMKSVAPETAPIVNSRSLKKMEDAGKISSDVGKTIHELRMLRNAAAHLPDFAIEREQALEYDRLAGQVLSAVEGARIS